MLPWSGQVGATSGHALPCPALLSSALPCAVSCCIGSLALHVLSCQVIPATSTAVQHDACRRSGVDTAEIAAVSCLASQLRLNLPCSAVVDTIWCIYGHVVLLATWMAGTDGDCVCVHAVMSSREAGCLKKLPCGVNLMTWGAAAAPRKDWNALLGKKTKFADGEAEGS